MQDEPTSVWVFNGGGSFPAAVFRSRERAEAWIRKMGVGGTDISVYEWATTRGLFTPKNEAQRSATFIARFSSAHQEHSHFDEVPPDDGRP